MKNVLFKSLWLALAMVHCQLAIVKAQGEANNWYFGHNAGLTFNTNPPSALTDGEMYNSEGVASISDANGNLLFYTNGMKIWNRNDL